MATPYTNYFPATYQPVYPQQIQYQQPVQQVQPQQPQGNGIVWVQGEGAARSYLLAPNTSIVLFDSESPAFYIKTTDQSGMPTLRKFTFEEITGSEQVPTQKADVEFATKEEVEELRKIINSMKNQNRNNKKINNSEQVS